MAGVVSAMHGGLLRLLRLCIFLLYVHRVTAFFSLRHSHEQRENLCRPNDCQHISDPDGDTPRHGELGVEPSVVVTHIQLRDVSSEDPRQDTEHLVELAVDGAVLSPVLEAPACVHEGVRDFR